MKKIQNIFIIITIFLILFLLPVHCQAESALEDLGELGNYGILQEEDSYDNFLSKVGVFLTFFQIIGSIISVICLVVIGIKYMMGSAEEKAEYKKTLMPYMIGAILIFAITNILSIIYDVAVKIL